MKYTLEQIQTMADVNQLFLTKQQNSEDLAISAFEDSDDFGIFEAEKGSEFYKFRFYV